MDLRKSPFYLLKASITDTRKKIVELAEEQSLILDDLTCSDARNILTNPQKRIVAEVKWPLDVSKEKIDEIFDYINCISIGEKCEELDFSDYSELTQLLIKMSIIEYQKITDVYKAKYLIQNISRLFDSIIPSEVQVSVNRNRQISGFPIVEKVSDIEAVLHEVREDIRRSLTNAIQSMGRSKYIEIATLLGDAYNDKYSGNIIIEDIISDYQLKMQSEIDIKQKEILDFVGFAKKSIKEIQIDPVIDDLSKKVEEWDKLVQPIQLLNQEHGQDEDMSLTVAQAIRGLAIELHNNYEETDSALRLTDLLKRFFSELPILLDVINQDSNALNDIKKNKELDEKFGSILKKFDVLDGMGDSVKKNPTDSGVDGYIDAVKSLNQSLINAEIDDTIIKDSRLKACFMARDVAVFLQNNYGKTEYSLRIINALKLIFEDIELASTRLLSDINDLNGILNQIEQNKKKEKAPARAAIIFYIVFFVIIIAIFSGNGSKSSTKSSTSSYSTTPVSQPSNYSFTKNQLDAKMDTLKAKIDDMESKLTEILDELDYYEQKCDETNNTNASYVNAYNAKLKEFQALYDEYDSKINEYNSYVAQYNSMN